MATTPHSNCLFLSLGIKEKNTHSLFLPAAYTQSKGGRRLVAFKAEGQRVARDGA